MLYSLLIDDIEYEHLEAFCQEDHEENEILDYKKDWPNNLEKTIAAMANTSGGIILVGVDEHNGSRRPVVPLNGITLGQGGVDSIKQKVTSKAYRAIYPPVFPEVRVCPMPTNESKAVVLIRIHESNRAPHATHSRTRVYIRVDSQSEPEPLANLEQLQWLFDRRAATIAHREAIIEAAWIRSEFELGKVDDADKRAQLIAFAVPLFPSGIVVPMTDLIKSHLATQQCKAQMKDVARSFPSSPSSFRPVVDGTRAFHLSDRPQYAELNTFGLVYLRQQFELASYPHGKAFIHAVEDTTLPEVLETHAVIGYIDALLQYSARFYNEAGFQGLVGLSASVEHIQGKYLHIEHLEDPHHYVSLDTKVDLLQQDILASEILSQRKELLGLAFSRLVWAFGYQRSEEDNKDWMSKWVLELNTH